MSAKMQVMFTVPRIFGIRNVIRPESVRSTKTKAESIKHLQKANKEEFGSLIETKKQKAAREKHLNKTVECKESAVDVALNKVPVDTESHYVNNSKNTKLLKFKSTGRKLPYSTKKIIIIKSTSVEVTENLKKIPTVEDSKPIIEAENTQSETKLITSNGNRSKEPSLPSKILINRITSFSYLDSGKNVIENLADKKPISISPYSDRTKLSIPSVTRILNKTMSPQSKLNLELWKQRMILALGQEGFEKYSQELLLNGKQFHSSIQNYLANELFEVPSTVEKSWQSVQHVLKAVSDVQVIESHAVHSKLYYRGVVDCVAMYRGNLCVIDWKKSDKPKNSIENTFDAPIQVASYIGALNSDSNYNFQVQSGLVVVGYTNGDPASVHEINPTLLNKYWRFWLRRLQQYYVDQTSAE